MQRSHMRPAASLLANGALGLALTFGLAGCKPEMGSAASVDAQAILPTGAFAKDQYTRAYLLAQVKSSEDTPYFTTSEEFDLAEPRRVWVAVYVLPDPLLETERPGLQVHAKAEQIPMTFHGGCGVVNLIADARSGETLASWCNVESTAPAELRQRIPRFKNPSSPFP